MLPASRWSAAKPEVATKVGSDVAIQEMRAVLFVDDEPLSQKYFKASIGAYAEVLTADNPIEARKILAARKHDIQVVVSDERMPLESGVPFLAEVSRSWPATRRVLTSAYADFDNLQSAINEASIYRFVPKPWNLDVLCDVVREALDYDACEGQKLARAALDPRTIIVSEMAQRIIQPLQTLESEAAQLMLLTGSGRLPPQQSAAMRQPLIVSWPNQVVEAQIAASASRLQRAAAACLSLAGAIAEITAKPRTLQ